jgi:hypothetical protein
MWGKAQEEIKLLREENEELRKNMEFLSRDKPKHDPPF